MTKTTALMLLAATAILMTVIGLWLHPIPQPQSYHQFADQRHAFGITRAWDVLSNLPFAITGLWGLWLLFSPGKIYFIHHQERWPWLGISIGLLLTALGSGYYHLAPDNFRLLWDRLPMTIVFTSFIAVMVMEKINMKLGLLLWLILLSLGIYSVVYWYWSELQHAGDLRLYFAIQIYTVAATLILAWVPSRYTRSIDLVIVAACYAMAKLFEIYDQKIFTLDSNIVSGHTLKHLAAAMAGFWLIRMLWKHSEAVT